MWLFHHILIFSNRPFNRLKFYLILLPLLAGLPALSQTNCHYFYLNQTNQFLSSFDLQYEKLLDQFDINFTKMTDPNLERLPLSMDLSEGYKKRLILKRFGLDFSDPDFQKPTFRQFLDSYIQVLNELKIPEHKRIYPTLVLIKGSVLGDSDYEIKFVTPGKDPWPQEDGYRIFQIGILGDPLTPPRDPFNVPPSDMLRAHQARRYPLLAFHDIGHFVSYALNESYTLEINRAFSQSFKTPLVPSFYNRMLIVLEFLSLGNPDLIPKMKAEFKANDLKYSDGVLPQSHFVESFEALDETSLLDHARWMGLNFSSFMRDYGGGSVGSREKGIYQIKDPAHAIEVLLGADPSRQPTSSNMNAPYRNVLLGLYNAYVGTIKEPKVYDKIIFKNLNISKWEELKGTKWTGIENGRDLIILLMRKHLASLEGFIWNSSHIPVEEWVKTLLENRPIDQNSNVIKVFTEFMTTDSFLIRSLSRDR